MSSFGRRWCYGVAAAFALAAIGAAAIDPVKEQLDLERGLPLIRNFPPQTYAGHNQVWCTAAAHDGTLFFGGKAAVYVFDGLSWATIPVPNGAFVRGLATDDDDAIWVGAVDELGRIVRDASGVWSYQSLRSKVPTSVGNLEHIWKVYATDQGVWFQSNRAVLRWREGHFDVWMMNEKAIVLSFWLKDRLLVARLKGWYEPGPNGTWVQLGETGNKLGDYLPHFAVPHPNGGWLMGIEGPHGDVLGLARWDGSQLTFQTHPLDEYFKAKRLYSAIRLADGRYVFTTLQGGAVILGSNLEFHCLLDEKSGLAADAVINAFEDEHRSVWFSTEFGMSRAEITPGYSWLTNAQGLQREMHHHVVRWHGKMIFGTSNGLVRLAAAADPAGNPRFVPWSTLNDKVYTLVPFEDGILVGALGGVWWVDESRAEKIDSKSNAFAIVPSSRHPGSIYVATQGGLFQMQRSDGKWSLTRLTAEVSGSNLCEAPDGTLWQGTENHGFVRITLAPDGHDAPPSLTWFHAEAGLPPILGSAFALRIGDDLVFCTDHGVFRFEPSTQRFQLNESLRLLGQDRPNVHKAIADPRGRLWLSISGNAETSEGATPIRIGYVSNGEWHALTLPGLERIGGVESMYFDAIAGREILWLNGQSSELRVDLTTLAASGDTPIGATVLHPPASTSGVPLNRQEAVPHVAAIDNSLRFRFGTPGFAGEPDVRHETRLLGFEDGAVELTAGGERTFTNLAAGHYTFEVRGRSADGRWSAPARQEFVVLAPWWQTAWAWLGYVGLGLAGTYGVIRRRTMTLENERKRLEAVVAERTVELASKNRELERLNQLEKDEKLAARLAEEKAQLELLRYQLNPHFLFNSLNSIRALVYAKPEAAGEMVSRLAEFCRWTLTRGSDEITTVAEEAEMVRAYLDIEKARWQDALVTRVEIDPAAREERLPQFLLLPLIENAIKYGGRTSPGTLEVSICIRRAEGRLECMVSNTGSWVDTGAERSSTSTHIGLENLRRRLARHYGPSATLEIERREGWVDVRLKLSRDVDRKQPEGSAI